MLLQSFHICLNDFFAHMLLQHFFATRSNGFWKALWTELLGSSCTAKKLGLARIGMYILHAWIYIYNIYIYYMIHIYILLYRYMDAYIGVFCVFQIFF